MQNNLTKTELQDIHFYLEGAKSYYEEWIENEKGLDMPEDSNNTLYASRQIHMISMIQDKILKILKEGV